MDLLQQRGLSTDTAFINRCESAMMTAAINVTTETTNEVQTIAFTGTVSGGTFTLTYAGQVTPAQPFNVSAAALQVALQALSTIGAGNCVVTGGPGPTAFVVTFTGTLGGTPNPLFTFSAASLTGATPGMTVTRTTPGVAVVNKAARAALAKLILLNPTGYAVLFAKGAATNVSVQADFDGTTFAPAGGVTEATIKNDLQFTINSIFGSFV